MYEIVWLNSQEFIIKFNRDGVSQFESSMAELSDPREIVDLIDFINQTLEKDD